MMWLLPLLSACYTSTPGLYSVDLEVRLGMAPLEASPGGASRWRVADLGLVLGAAELVACEGSDPPDREVEELALLGWWLPAAHAHEAEPTTRLVLDASRIEEVVDAGPVRAAPGAWCGLRLPLEVQGAVEEPERVWWLLAVADGEAPLRLWGRAPGALQVTLDPPLVLDRARPAARLRLEVDVASWLGALDEVAERRVAALEDRIAGCAAGAWWRP